MENKKKRVSKVRQKILKEVLPNDQIFGYQSFKGLIESQKSNNSKLNWKNRSWYDKWITNWGGNKPK